MTPKDNENAAAREQRRRKREERRELQRAANPGRARKMHAARLLWEKSGTTLATDAILPKIIVGCSGWFYWHWRGDVYPAEMPTKEWFPYYARRFNTVELNAPFYSWPTVAVVESWLRQAGRRKFIYTVKVSELITHQKKFAGTKTLVRDFGHIANLLGPRMGCFLFQLPPSFHYTPARLRGILAQMDPARRNVVEFRHRSWWNARVYEAFCATKTIFCSCSAPNLPDDLIATSDEVYLRFHGTSQWYRHDYTRAELLTWVEKVRASEVKHVWAYFNNDREGYAVKNARTFRRLLAQE